MNVAHPAHSFVYVAVPPHVVAILLHDPPHCVVTQRFTPCCYATLHTVWLHKTSHYVVTQDFTLCGYTSQVGIPSLVLERGPRLQEGGAALALWSNAWRALDALGVADGLRSRYLALDKVELCRKDGVLLRSFTFDECGEAVLLPGERSS
jgi:hypothetical protein